MKHRFWFYPFLILAMFALVLTGCGDKRTAKEVLTTAAKQQNTVTSYQFSGKLKLRADMQGDDIQSDPHAKMVLDALNKAQITYRGNTSLSPLKTEFILDVSVPLDGMSMNFTMPILMNQEKLWVKIPALSLMPELNHLAGKFVELDYKELSQWSGQPIPAAVDPKKQQELTGKLIDVFAKDMGDEYFADVAKDSVALPQDVETERVVKFQLTNEKLPVFLKTLLGSTLPQCVDLIAQSELADQMGMSKEQAEQAKADLSEALKELESNQEWVKMVHVDKAEWMLAVNKENHIPYQQFDFDMRVTPPNEPGTLTIGFTFDQKVSGINVPPKWEVQEPKAEETIKFMDLLTNGAFMGM